jgi:hypothetical protein
LNDVPKFQRRGLQDLQALLQLRRQHLLHCQILKLMDPRTSHTDIILRSNRDSKRAADELQAGRIRNRTLRPSERQKVCAFGCARMVTSVPLIPVMFQIEFPVERRNADPEHAGCLFARAFVEFECHLDVFPLLVPDEIV